MLRKIYYSEGIGLEEEERKRRKRVDIAGVEQAVLQRKEGEGRVKDDVRALSKRAFLASVGCLL
jgi:hypothetical protein